MPILFEVMSEGIVLITPQGQIVQANPAAESILGLKRSEIEDRNYIMIFVTGDLSGITVTSFDLAFEVNQMAERANPYTTATGLPCHKLSGVEYECTIY